MKNDKPIDISVKIVFTGHRSVEQAFIDLIRRRNGVNPENKLVLIPNLMYDESVVFPGVHEAPERGICYE